MNEKDQIKRLVRLAVSLCNIAVVDTSYGEFYEQQLDAVIEELHKLRNSLHSYYAIHGNINNKVGDNPE